MRRPSVPMERTPNVWSAKWFSDFCRDVLFQPLRLDGYTVDTLPAGKVGHIAFVTDADTPVYGSAVVGGGATFRKVVFDGTNWIVG